LVAEQRAAVKHLGALEKLDQLLAVTPRFDVISGFGCVTSAFSDALLHVFRSQMGHAVPLQKLSQPEAFVCLRGVGFV